MLRITGPASGEFFAGNDHEWVFTVTINDVAVDLTGMTCRFVMARNIGATPVISTETTSPTAVATINSPPTDGMFTIALEAVDTVSLMGTYQYQTQVEDTFGNVSNVLHGYFTFRSNLFT